MIGTAWVDEAAYLRPSPSRLHAALGSHTAWSEEDLSFRKLLRWQLEDRQNGVFEQAV